mgnify:CR=1 FL=1
MDHVSDCQIIRRIIVTECAAVPFLEETGRVFVPFAGHPDQGAVPMKGGDYDLRSAQRKGKRFETDELFRREHGEFAGFQKREVCAVGQVQGFAFTLGLTTILDVVVVFLVTWPLVHLASKSKFWSKPEVNGLGAVAQIAYERKRAAAGKAAAPAPIKGA